MNIYAARMENNPNDYFQDLKSPTKISGIINYYLKYNNNTQYLQCKLTKFNK